MSTLSLFPDVPTRRIVRYGSGRTIRFERRVTWHGNSPPEQTEATLEFRPGPHGQLHAYLTAGLCGSARLATPAEIGSFLGASYGLDNPVSRELLETWLVGGNAAVFGATAPAYEVEA